MKGPHDKFLFMRETNVHKDWQQEMLGQREGYY